MPEVDFGVVRELHQLDHIVVHVRGGSLKQTSTAGHKERIAGKHRLFRCKIGGNMAAGMTRDKQKARFEVADTDRIALIDHMGNARRARLVPLMAVDFQLRKLFDQFLIAAHMVPVMVGVDDGRKIYALALDRRGHRTGLGRINHAGLVGRFINQHIGVIIGQHRDSNNSHTSPPVNP